MLKGIITHITLAILLTVAAWYTPQWLSIPLFILWGFWMREYGEAKWFIKGKFYSWDKQIEMLKHTIRWHTSKQYVLPFIASVCVVVLMYWEKLK